MQRALQPAALLWLAASAGAVLLAMRLELLEGLYQFSRLHEDWEIDEFFAISIVAGVTLPLFQWRWNRRLAMAQRQTREAQDEAQRVALQDPLTGLPNRRAVHEYAMRAAEREGPGGVTLLLLDLDRFKPVNDLRGHDAGDLLLRAVAQRLRQTCPEDAMVARLGGDEFVVVLARADASGMGETLAQHILQALTEPFDFDGWSAGISCSIGVADWMPGLGSADLLRMADQAMYRAKQSGRDGWSRFDGPLGDRQRERAALEQDLRVALAIGAITPWFQPIWAIGGRSLRGVEVLARWIDPRRGFVPPDVFIPLAEELGQIERLSELVLDRACAAAAAWPLPLPFSFNLSPRQFADPNLPRRILEILGRHGLPGSRLEIEITERAVLADIDVARRIVRDLAEAGVRVSLDDFGTGTSSLAILTQLPIDHIKIDRSFIAGVDRLPERGKIVTGVLALAESLGLSVTAEGIERDEELRFLQQRHCARGQGFLLGRPQPAEGIAQLLADEPGILQDAG
ncbi:putative bifunctional diguanylate cyclase/phosphodiesterase [Rubellimicrobium roseum]|uniref:putative bifunctional diguanylate cyclase/phosphodiesterase n=1 Tax=Rubellimicrobium roseum TaxID=687525 RepID=UPI00159BD8A7|nr:EAL domain-containing protein [Rubellimicrobium roseum]